MKVTRIKAWSSSHSQYRAQAFPSSFSLLVLNVLLRGGLLSNPSLGVGFLPVHSIIVSHLDVGSSVGSPVHTCQRNAEAIRVAPRDVEGEDAAGLTESCSVERNLCCELFRDMGMLTWAMQPLPPYGCLRPPLIEYRILLVTPPCLGGGAFGPVITTRHEP